jgi:hypothetical protein
LPPAWGSGNGSPRGGSRQVDNVAWTGSFFDMKASKIMEDTTAPLRILRYAPLDLREWVQDIFFTRTWRRVWHAASPPEWG